MALARHSMLFLLESPFAALFGFLVFGENSPSCSGSAPCSSLRLRRGPFVFTGSQTWSPRVMYNTRTGWRQCRTESGNESLEHRIARLEQALRQGGISHRPQALSEKRFLSCLVVGAVAAFLCFRGLGWPNHPYQEALGALTIALAYHRRWLLWPRRWYEWGIAPLNAFLVAALFKLIIGSGVRHPLYWLNYPEMKLERQTGKWMEVLPEFKILWQPMPIASWEIDPLFDFRLLGCDYPHRRSFSLSTVRFLYGVSLDSGLASGAVEL